ncbi:MAG: hypothetical protein KW793_03940 [Candidatus Doudnabacteria bacterium]|nr:hypothetical protein [Candidatus Doudnabacteria bacterium]
MSEKVIAGLKAEVRTIVLKMRSDSTSSEKRASVHKTVADAASVKRRALRAQISPDSTTQKFAEVAELEIQSLGEIIATKDSAFTLQVKSLYQVISLERLKSSHQQVLISDLGGENQALKREVKKQKRGKFAFKTATGILVVGLAILFSQ